MKKVIWSALSAAEQQAVLLRPAMAASESITDTVAHIIEQVTTEGDAALKKLSAQFDKVELNDIRLSSQAMKEACDSIPAPLKTALREAFRNIRSFHAAQVSRPLSVETQPGVVCEMHSRAIEAVGLYIPGGSAPLPSTVLMLGVPSEIAGCKRRVLVSPPPIAPEIVFAASLCGIDEIYQVGGAQAVAALAFGTESVPKVDKIFGPGNSFVTEAKRQVSQAIGGASIDMPAGPSEVMVIADARANADFIAADLLSQAEHGPDSQVVVVTPSDKLADEVNQALTRQVAKLSRADIAEKALENSIAIVCQDMAEAVVISNIYGPEHLIVQTKNPRQYLNDIQHAGSVFLGDWTPESVGDYASGTNHVLPTYGYVRTYSSLSLMDFCKRFTVQELSADGLSGLAPVVTAIADAEGLDAHANAVHVRTQALEGSK
ncbi:histidinol dehydrogenase [Echinimonas agarilytica]|uniref:Histidinol dehydrogenase n=1 Tax=Echinimonas agarilytica TaxID=1215918 RepID=A0AA41W5T5_9GAMM|nr:histidinol dehydrogenase [Echinimonas agarilytica]MCM2679422.1 histidinol dehydrogenase [Echinimonas agarilytica]